MNFDFDKKQREVILDSILEKIENYYSNTKDFRITPELNIEKIREYLDTIDLVKGNEPIEGLNHVINGLEDYSVHTPHPRYFGLFNPRSNFAGIIADLITASYNPQLAAWSHAPFAVEVEAKLIRNISSRFGYDTNSADGAFTTGGAEANLTAILCALNHKYPNYAKIGLFGIDKKPIIFCSEEAHHSIQKAAKVSGLGYDLVKSISITNNLKLDVGILESQIKKLENTVYTPLMVVGTAGTTGTGTVDDLDAISEICKRYNIWFHVDAAYGGASVLSTKLKHLLKGIEYSDSITFDAHKWMSVPMGTSVFLTSHNEILAKTFRITTEYMPKEATKMDVVEPFTHSIQWSRRFNGLKVYLSLLFYGWNGYEKVINHQVKIANYLRRRLSDNGWIIKNETNLPVICFIDERFEMDTNFTQMILDKIIAKGKSWLSVYPIKGVQTFRACITNYNTTEKEVDELLKELNNEREQYDK